MPCLLDAGPGVGPERPDVDLSIVEARRRSSGKSVQQRCLYLGENNDSQQEHWRKTLELFDETTPL